MLIVALGSMGDLVPALHLGHKLLNEFECSVEIICCRDLEQTAK